MDVGLDNDMDSIDGLLLNQFQAMGTTDKDVLISQFQNLLGFQLNPAGCAFFLDMTNWNLQSAIGAYYDFEGAPQSKMPSMTFLFDVSVREGEAITPNTAFLKIWKIQNSGPEDWPSGCTLRFLSGNKMGSTESVPVFGISASQSIEVSINFISPTEPGMYQGRWRLYTNTGTPFGDEIWVIICVRQCGIPEFSQQTSTVNCGVDNESSIRKSVTFDMQQQSNEPMSESPCEEGMAFDEVPTQSNHNNGEQTYNNIYSNDGKAKLYDCNNSRLSFGS